MYDFDKVVDRKGTSSIKWNVQYDFGQKDGLTPFWIADTDFAIEPGVIQALKERLEHPCFGYADPWDDVYESIRSWWDRRHHVELKKEWMLISSGVVTAIYMNLQLLIPKGEKCLVLTPIYDPFFAAIENSGHTLVTCSLDRLDVEKEIRYSINFERLEEEFRQGVKAMIFCNPHNPIAKVWTREEVEKVVELCKKYDVYLLSDEVHCDYAMERPYTSALSFAEQYEKIIVYTAISKSFNMAGMVSSCLMIPDGELKKKIQQDFESRWMFGPSDLAFTAMEAAYRLGDQWMDEARSYVASNAQQVIDFAKEFMPEVKIARQEGTFLMWLDMSCLKKTSSELTMILAKDYGIAVGDGSHYGKEAEGFLRLNIGCARTILQIGLDALKKAYDDLLK